MQIVLARKERLMEEPVLRDLRLVISTYNALAAAEAPEKPQHLHALMQLFFGKTTPPLYRCTADELAAFLLAIPTVCQLEQSSGKTDKATDWGALYAHLCMTFGWDYHTVDGQMTLSKLNELRGYLDDHPATHLLVAAYLGYENPNKTNSPQAFFDRLRATYGKLRRR